MIYIHWKPFCFHQIRRTTLRQDDQRKTCENDNFDVKTSNGTPTSPIGSPQTCATLDVSVDLSVDLSVGLSVDDEEDKLIFRRLASVTKSERRVDP